MSDGVTFANVGKNNGIHDHDQVKNTPRSNATTVRRWGIMPPFAPMNGERREEHNHRVSRL